MRSAANAEAGDQRAVALDVLTHEVVEKTAALTDEQVEAATRVVVVRVSLEVLGAVGDALRQDGDLDLGRARVALMGGVLGDELLLALGGNRHCGS